MSLVKDTYKNVRVVYLLVYAVGITILCLALFAKGNFYTAIKNRLLDQVVTSSAEMESCHKVPDLIVNTEYGYTWEKFTCAAEFAPRDGAGALVYDDSLRLIGGWNPYDKNNFPRITNNEVWSSLNGLRWRRTKENTFVSTSFDATVDWEGRHTAGYVLFRNEMCIVGGDPNQGHYQNDVWCSADGDTWKMIDSDVPWAPRALHITMVYDNKIWVIGGQTLSQLVPGVDTLYSDIWSSSNGRDWVQVSTEAGFPPRGMIGGSVVYDGYMWIIGGGTYDTPSKPERAFYNDVWRSKDGVYWELVLNNAPWDPRQYHNIVVFDNRIWVIEGYNEDSGNRNDVWFSENGIEWNELKGSPWREWHASSVFVKGDSLYVVAGNNMESDVWVLYSSLD